MTFIATPPVSAPKKRTLVIVGLLALISAQAFVSATLTGVSLTGEIELNFEVTADANPYNLWFHRYMAPSSTSDCGWVGNRALIVFAGIQSDVSCFHQANPNITVVSYLDRGVYSTEPLALSLWNDESAWLHWQNGSRAYFLWNNRAIYLFNPAASSVRNFGAANWILEWKTLGVDGLFLDDGYYPCKINSRYRICTQNGSPLAEFNGGDYLSWVQAWSDWANWVKAQMARPFYIYPNTVSWYTTINSTILSAWLSGMDGAFLEYFPRLSTWGDEMSQYYQMQSTYYEINPNAIINFFPTSGPLPSLYWLAAYYLLAKNFTTNNLYLSPPLNYPVPQGFCCEGWNSAVWDSLNLGRPLGPASITDAFGDGTASLYIRYFRSGVVVAMQDRIEGDTRTVNVNLNDRYYNITGGPATSQMTIRADRAFIGSGTQSSSTVPLAALLPWSAVGIGVILSTAVLRQRRRVQSSPDV